MAGHPASCRSPEHLLQHAGWMKALARSLVSDDARAEDVVQETWLSVLKRAPAQEAPRDTISWLKAVVRNFARENHRKERRRARRELLVARREAAHPTSEELLERFEVHRKVVEQVLELGEPYRSTILLRFFEELTVREIARREGVPIPTVKTRLRRALERLRERLDRLHGGDRKAWCGAFLLFLGLDSVRAPAALASSGMPLLEGVFMGSSLKVAVTALVLSALILGLGGAGLFLGSSGSEPGGPATGESSVRGPEGPSTGLLPSGPPEGDAGATDSPGAREEVARVDGGSSGPLGGPLPAPESSELPPSRKAGPGEDLSGEALEVAREYSKLKEVYGQGGRSGWMAVKDEIRAIREVLAGDAGIGQLLVLLDEEKDGHFAEALLHHLPLPSKTDDSPGENHLGERLQEELWSRFEEEEDPRKRMAYLGYFSYNPRLSGKRIEGFMETAAADPSPLVRSKAIDALTSATDLLPETWPTLCDVAERDPDESCQALAISGLAGVASERASAIVRGSFRSPSEKIRAAVLRSLRGDPPPEVTGGDLTAYLRKELRSARTREYKAAVVEKLMKVSPAALEEELSRALEVERDFRVKKDFREALERLKEVPGARGR